MSIRSLVVRPSALVSVLGTVWRHPANRRRRVRKVVETLGFQARTRWSGRPYPASIGRHSRLWARPGSPSARAVYANPPDWAEMLVWRRALTTGSLFVDVGANVGLYTLWALDAGATVVAVEPNPAALDELRANLALNHYEAEIVEAALAGEPGEMDLAGPDLARQQLVIGKRAGAAPARRVPVTTLDLVLAGRPAAGVKIDVEGAELLVLHGARNALAEGRIAMLQLEWNECSLELLGQDRASTAEFLAQFGYELFRPDLDGNLAPLEDPAPGADVFAMKRS